MAGKKVGFRPKPTQPTPDDWVQSRAVPPDITQEEATTELEQPPEPVPFMEPKPATTPLKKKMKRLTLDIPEELHTEIKMLAIQEGKPMVDLIVGLIRDRLSK